MSHSLTTIKESIHTSMNTFVHSNDYWLEAGPWTYAFEAWSPPASGRLLRQDRQATKDQWKELLDLNNLPADLAGSQVLELSLKADGQLAALLIKDEDHNQLVVMALEEEVRILDRIKGSRLLSTFAFVEAGLVYGQADGPKAVTKIYYRDLEIKRDSLIYEENHPHYHLQINSTLNNQLAIIRLTDYSEGSYLMTDGQKTEAVWSFGPEDYFQSTTLTLLDQDFLAILAYQKEAKTYQLTLMNQNFRLNLKLQSRTLIQQIVGQHDCLFIERKNGQHGLLNLRRNLNLCSPDIHWFDQAQMQLGRTLNARDKVELERSSDYLYRLQYRYDLDEGALELVGRTYRSSQYEGIHYQEVKILGQDKETLIPVSLFWRGSSQLRPFEGAVLHTYGAHGREILDQTLDPMALAIIEAGLLYGVGHIRGGSYYGKSWQRAGQGLQKWQAIEDALACVTYFKEALLQPHGRLGLMSSGAGGVIAGAVLNESAPSLDALLLFSPFINPLDKLTESDTKINAADLREWGNPLDSPQTYDYLKSYCPAHNTHKIQANQVRLIVLADERDPYFPLTAIQDWQRLIEAQGVQVCLLKQDHLAVEDSNLVESPLVVDALAQFIADLLPN